MRVVCPGEGVGKDFDDDGSDALAEDAKLAGGTPGEVDDAAPDKGSSVGDAHHYLLAIQQVGHFQQRTEGQRLMGAGH